MNRPRIGLLFLLLTCILTGCAKPPPLVVRYDRSNATFGFHVTNSSELTLHRITFHCEQNGTKTSAIAIDTIRPHQTVFLDVFRSGELRKSLGIISPAPRTVTVTCIDFERPLPVDGV